MARKRVLWALASLSAIAVASIGFVAVASAGRLHRSTRHSWISSTDARTRTPIKHVVVIFQENVSFDHYFGTYPKAANTDGQPFYAAPGTPAVDGLTPATSHSLPPNLRHSTDLTKTNPNLDLPQRLDSTPTGQSGGPGGQLTCDQDHDYSDEQQAFDNGNMDHFVQSTGTDGGSTSPFGTPCQAAQVMDYYDGNTVTGMWNYAQNYSLEDNSFGTTFGPSSPGAINVTSGDTGNVDTTHMVNNPPVSTSTSPNGDITPDGNDGYSLTSDAQPYYDDCSTRDAVAMGGQNIGDVLNAAGLSWGWFQGGFRPTTTFAAASSAVDPGQSTATFTPDEFSGSFTGKNVPPHASNEALCDSVTPVGVALGGTGQWGYKDDYIPHHEPFQYYASTANPHHLTVPVDGAGQDTLAGLQEIGTDTQSYVGGVPQFNTPNHQYDTSDFNQLVAAIGDGELPPSALPAVTYLKAPGYEDGHPGYSDPEDEQVFVTKVIDALMRTPDWKSTAVIINWDDSDGWYDHVYSGVTNPSLSPADNLTNTNTNKIGTGQPTSGQCGPKPQTKSPLAGEQGRCGFGPRIPMLVISPWARVNHVDSDLTDQASVLNFIEYNWNLPSIAGSADQVLAGTDRKEGIPFDLAGAFDFYRPQADRLILNPITGQPAFGNDGHHHQYGGWGQYSKK